MSRKASIGRIVLVLGLAFSAQHTAHAQFGGFSLPGNLPEDDFTWRWGDQRGSRIDDFSITGLDTGFNCTLTGELRPGSRFSQADLRDMQARLRSSMSFIEAATNMMNRLERQRDLGWAVLDCTKPGSDEDD